MSNNLLAASLKLKGMSSTCKLVLLVLSSAARDDNGGQCWPSVSSIAESCCLSDRAVRTAIKWLVDNGALQAKRQFNNSSIYTVTPEQYSTTDRRSPPEQYAYTPAPRSIVELRSPPEYYSPPAPRAAPPCTTCRTPLNNVPNKRNLNVTETKLEKEGVREDFSFDKIDTKGSQEQQPRIFKMYVGWTPEPKSWEQTLRASQHLTKNKSFTDYNLAEFIRRNVDGQEKTESAWQKYYVNAFAKGMLDEVRAEEKQQSAFKQKQPEITPPVYKNWSLEPDEPLKPKITREQLAEMRRIVDGEK